MFEHCSGIQLVVRHVERYHTYSSTRRNTQKKSGCISTSTLGSTVERYSV